MPDGPKDQTFTSAARSYAAMALPLGGATAAATAAASGAAASAAELERAGLGAGLSHREQQHQHHVHHRSLQDIGWDADRAAAGLSGPLRSLAATVSSLRDWSGAPPFSTLCTAGTNVGLIAGPCSSVHAAKARNIWRS